MGIVVLRLWKLVRSTRLVPKASSKRSKTESVPRSQCILVWTLTRWIQHVRSPVGMLALEPSLTRALDVRMVLTCAADAPATGTPETGGWSTRELRTIIRGLEDVKLVAADIVEVAPAYDTNAELTTMAAADVLYDILTLMVKKGPLSKTVAAETGEGTV